MHNGLIALQSEQRDSNKDGLLSIASSISWWLYGICAASCTAVFSNPSLASLTGIPNDDGVLKLAKQEKSRPL
jgi:hypothetical protein